MHFHRHPFVHCFFVQHINATSSSLCRDYGVNSYTAITSRRSLLFVLCIVLRRRKTGGWFNLIFCYAFNMQNNLKSVTFFFEKFLKFFFCILFGFALRYFCRQIANPICWVVLILTGFNLRAILSSGNPNSLFKLSFCIFFCSHVSLYLCDIPAGRYGTASHARPYQAFIFCCFFCRPAFYACCIFSPAILIC